MEGTLQTDAQQEDIAGATDDFEDLIIRDARPGEEDELVALLQAGFGTWPRVDCSVPPVEHLRWKLRLDRPGERRAEVVELGGRTVLMGIRTTEAAKVGDRIVPCGSIVDLCMQPDLQRRGLLTALANLHAANPPPRQPLSVTGQSRHPAFQRLRFRYDTPATPVFGNRIDRFIRPGTARELAALQGLHRARSKVKLARRAARVAAWYGERAREPFLRGCNVCTVRNVSGFDGRVDMLWEETAPSLQFATVRTREYLNWRYADPRAGNFTIFTAEESERLLGYLVLCPNAHDETWYIADLFVVPGQPLIARSLVREAVAHTRRQPGPARIECWLPIRHAYALVLAEFGFISKQLKQPIGYRAEPELNEEVRSLSDPATAIHYTIGDTDIV